MLVTPSSARALAVQPAAPSAARSLLDHTVALDGLLSVHVDRLGGGILLTLPAPGADGVSGRFLYATALRSGLGAAPTFLGP